MPRPGTPVEGPAAERFANHNAIIFSNQAANARAQSVAQDEARNQPLVPLNTGQKWVFRSLPGTLRQFSVRIPTVPESFKDDKAEERYMKAFRRRRERHDGSGAKFDYEDLRNRVGKEYIQFRAIPGGPDRQQTCFYATSDPDVYEFLMHQKRTDTTGMWKNIIVEKPTKLIDVNGQKVPATMAGWEAAQAAIMADDSAEE